MKNTVRTILGLLAATGLASARTLTGTVLNLDSSAAVGVSVTLASTGATTTTDASGNWSLSGTSTGINSAPPTDRAVSGHLVLDGDRVHLAFSGFDILGRGLPNSLAPVRSTVQASARAAASMDTLTYSLNGKVFLRDTVSESRSGIVRLYDTTWNPAILYGWVTDTRDGQLYRSVTIGTQVWLAQNLNFKPAGADSGWCFNDSSIYCKTYGRLYMWSEAVALNDSCNTKVCSTLVAAKQQGICPSGWHVPSDAEWTTLQAVVDPYNDTDGTRLKSTGSWLPKGSVSGDGTDVYGFRAMSGGDANDGLFAYVGYDGNFWSASEYAATYAWLRFLHYDYTFVYRTESSKTFGYSLRCTMD
jgi:uncharacterized protein (TIGR02145 family)